jgi:hypothetical protein
MGEMFGTASLGRGAENELLSQGAVRHHRMSPR